MGFFYLLLRVVGNDPYRSKSLNDGPRFFGGDFAAAEVQTAQVRAREDVWQQLVDEEEVGRCLVVRPRRADALH